MGESRTPKSIAPRGRENLLAPVFDEQSGAIKSLASEPAGGIADAIAEARIVIPFPGAILFWNPARIQMPGKGMKRRSSTTKRLTPASSPSHLRGQHRQFAAISASTNTSKK